MNNVPVLVVDDSQASLNIITSIVKLCGFADVDQALSVEVAIGLLEIRKYGLILADMFMPGSTGMDLLQFIRSHEDSTPFVLMTALRDPAIISMAVRFKADSVLLKPFTVAGLKEKLSGLPGLRAA
jgi:CheY-like chemotaxis protein